MLPRSTTEERWRIIESRDTAFQDTALHPASRVGLARGEAILSLASGWCTDEISNKRVRRLGLSGNSSSNARVSDIFVLLPC